MERGKRNDLVKVVVAVGALPLNANMLETIVVPTVQPYLGRG
jgi:hypothetical protein